MQLLVIQCNDRCQRKISIAVEPGFDKQEHTGVYLCPVCKSYEIDRLFGPVEIEPPKIKLTKEGMNQLARIPKRSPRRARATSEVVNGTKPQTLPIGQLYSPGRGNDELGEGPLPQLQEPIADGGILPWPSPSDVPECQGKTKEALFQEYEAEAKKYLGI